MKLWPRKKILMAVPTVRLFLLLLAAAVFLAGPVRAEADDFSKGREAVIEGNFEEALEYLREYLEENPNGKYASRAYLFVGKACVGLKQYDQAKSAFRELIEKHPSTLEGYKAQYKIAEIEMLTGHELEARRLFTKMAEEKNGPFTAESQMYLDYLDLH